MALFFALSGKRRFELRDDCSYNRLMIIKTPRSIALCAAISATMVLSGCGPAQNDPGPGGVTVGEAKALDEAAEMLDERNAPPEPIDQQTSSQAMAEGQPQQ
ncbi:hypothetical protein [Parasphingorhabdus halotolerans]|uniref:Uncharacterized protein n=1 Tax=Parasphingorhabdus halotolerans TaxID=2725558 RepID=A0A6H2DHS5_9SPHN|nr:hypothetical protein [Parasphingorhabdus halotolerans]QJB67884.1 hypothetical protein HF685_07495 [Parasphingorhabdus halotolerans]